MSCPPRQYELISPSLSGAAATIADHGAGDVERPLEGHRVLLVEDDVFVGLDIAHLVSDLGGEVIGPARTLASAMRMAQASDFHLALLDVNLEGELTFELAAQLAARSVPTLFITAYASDEALFPADVKSIPRLAKPVHRHSLLDAINRIL